jgi:hypothetical protein
MRLRDQRGRGWAKGHYQRLFKYKNYIMKKILVTMGMLSLFGMASGQVFAAAAPTITSITPANGTAAGGTSITIAGTHLDSAVVRIGGALATNVVVATSSQSLTATTPAGTAGARDVVVSNANGTSTLTGGFTYTTPPAACNGSTFDTFTNGSVNGQGGWKVTGPYDQEVVPNTFGYASFGCKTLQISDATTSVFIFNQIFSSSTLNTGELSALNDQGATGTPRNHFEGQFDLASVTQNEQPGMHLSVSPDRGDGTRMSSLGFNDTSAGIDVFFDDVTGTSSTTNFNDTQIASNLTRSVPHTIKYSIDFNEGPSNDVVKVYIDGNLVHTGTSWENFYRYDSGAFGGPTPNNSRTVNSLVFYERGTANASDTFNGFLVDNVSLTSTTTTATSTGTTTPPASTSTPPTITLNGSSTMNVLLNSTFTDPGATAVDSASTSLTVTATGTVNTAATGTYSIVYSATDSHNLTASTTRTVNVNGTTTATSTGSGTSTPPVITLNGSSTMDVLLNSTFTDPGATAVDSASTSIPVTATGTVNTAATGTYTIVYSAIDSNNLTASTTRTVNVNATSTATTTPPVVAPSEGGAGGPNGVPGCRDKTALNYDPTALYDGPCTYAATTSGGGGSSSSSGGLVLGASTSTVDLSGSSTATTTVPVYVYVTPKYNFGRDLKFGIRSGDVLELQKILIASGYLTINVPTNYFGTLTKNALKKWQKANGISPASGFFGPISRAFLMR